ncbi:hypothetical protein [Nostoc sp.]|uniref:hypothetical protein n=1 Tax=Nostoc sp. TaxID=1180 RepID=UPI002FF52ABD
MRHALYSTIRCDPLYPLIFLPIPYLLSGYDGWIEVLSSDTAILRIVPQSGDDEDAEDSVMMRLFLDFAMTEALKNNTLQPYTTEMSQAARELIAGVKLDDESLEDG